MDAPRALADRLDSGRDLKAYSELLAFQLDGPGGSRPWQVDRLLRKPLAALDRGLDRLAQRHADAHCNVDAQDVLMLIATASLLDSDFHRRRPGQFRRPWQGAWEEICEATLDAAVASSHSSSRALHDYQYGFERWCDKWLNALLQLAPSEQHDGSSPIPARWTRARKILERELQRDLGDEPWVTELADRLHHVGRGLVTGIGVTTAERVVVAYDGSELIDLPWPAQYLLWAQYPGGTRQVGNSQHHLTALPRLFILLDRLSRRSLEVIGDTAWHDSPAVFQQAIDGVAKAAFSPAAHCWWNATAAGKLPRLLHMARADADAARQQAQRAQAPWR
ncbi:hypothetical protein ABZ702_25590 [Streptomyces cyaneofuscatus]|uniref:hypothetical protein n=1 Tax=Streptomyces cyaneofuscatus TaxID=66883 RepID=UPI0033EFDBFC